MGKYWSSARNLPYDLRPAKQTERRLLLDFIGCAKEGGVPVSGMRYVGMGGFKFYDFVMMHRFVGLTDMKSIEADSKLVPRCKFNVPYSFIEVVPMSCGQFLASEKESPRTIYWLDYDGALSSDVIDDIQTLGVCASEGSMIFVSVNSGLPGDLRDLSERERLADLKEQFGDFADGLTEEDVEESAFSGCVYRVLLKALVDSFAARNDAAFFPDFRVSYKDGAPMVTVGGCFCDSRTGSRVREAVSRSLPFLVSESQPFQIQRFNLSERERTLFDCACSTTEETEHKNSLLALGFKESDLNGYSAILRFVPRYFEAMV